MPVLAGELIELLDPQPGAVAVDCTVGGGGHARLVAERIGASGTLIGIDRDPTARERFEELAREVSCETRFIRASFVDGPDGCSSEERLDADAVYFDLGTSSMQIDTWERGFSYSYDAPLDMRMDPDQELTAARDRRASGTSAGSRACCASTARSASPRRSRGRSSPSASARRSSRRSSSSR